MARYLRRLSLIACSFWIGCSLSMEYTMSQPLKYSSQNDLAKVSGREDYQPEFTSMVHPNAEPDQIALLQERYGAQPRALSDAVILVPATKLEERKAEYPHIDVLPITFAASELKAMHWKFLMGAVGSQSMYLRQVNLIMRKLRDQLTLAGLLDGV